jgi:hypothetical protein
MEVSRGVECRGSDTWWHRRLIVLFNLPRWCPTDHSNAIAENCFILPSERVSLSAQRIATLLTDAGSPPVSSTFAVDVKVEAIRSPPESKPSPS